MENRWKRGNLLEMGDKENAIERYNTSDDRALTMDPRNSQPEQKGPRFSTAVKLRLLLRFSLFFYISWTLLSSPVFNSPIYELKTNYLQWSSTLPAFSVCPAKSKEQKPGIEGFIENLVHPGKKYCANCKNTTNYPVNNYRNIIKSKTDRCSELILDCYWNGMKLDCCSVFKHLPTLAGSCYSINSEMTGFRYKLEVSHYSKQGELYFTTAKDVQVYIHDPKEVDVSESYYFIMRKGEKSDVIFRFRESVAEESANLLSIRNRGCILSKELANYPLYSISMCKMRCLAKEQAKLCGCIHHLNTINVNAPDCNITGLICLDRKLNKIKKSQLQKKCLCLPSCEEMDIAIVWQNLSRTESKLAQAKFFIIYPPSEKGFLHSRYQLIDAIVLVACLSRLFTNISVLDIWKMWIKRKEQKYRTLNYYDNILL